MNESQLRELLPAERSLPAHRRRTVEESLMTRIDQEPQPTMDAEPALAGASGPSRWRLRRRVVGGAAVLVLATGGGVAAAQAFRTGPDPVEADRVDDVFSNIESVHTPDWRWGLRAENVTCTFPDGTSMETNASEFPLDEMLTTDHLVWECSQGNDAARMVGGFDATPARVCVGGDDHPVAAVTLDGRSCDAVDPGLRPMTDADLAELNHMRAIEVALLAAPQDCATEEQAVTWAEQVVAAEDLDLAVEVTPQMPDGSPAPPGVTPPSSMVVPVPPPPGEQPQVGGTVDTTIVTPDDAPALCYVARVDWARPVIEIQGGQH